MLHESETEYSTRGPEWTPEHLSRFVGPALPTPMTERDWELYRLSMVDRIPDSQYKRAVVSGIQNKLRVLEMADASAPAMKETSGETG
jgi:hypothetical protein